MGWGLVTPEMQHAVLSVGRKEYGGFANALLISAFSLSQFACAFVEKFFGLFVERTVTNVIIGAGISMIVVAVITLAYVIWNPLKTGKEQLEAYTTPNTD